MFSSYQLDSDWKRILTFGVFDKIRAALAVTLNTLDAMLPEWLFERMRNAPEEETSLVVVLLPVSWKACQNSKYCKIWSKTCLCRLLCRWKVVCRLHHQVSVRYANSPMRSQAWSATGRDQGRCVLLTVIHNPGASVT